MILFLIACIAELIYILKFRSVILKIVLLVSVVPQITMIAFTYGFAVPGVLMLHAGKFSHQTIIVGNLLCCAVNVIMLRVLYPLRTNTYSYPTFVCTKTSYILLLAILAITALLSYPRVSGLNFRIDLSTIFISVNVFLLLCRLERKSWLNILHLLILLLVIAGGDRVDSIAAVVMLLLIVKDKNIAFETQPTKQAIAAGGIALFIINLYGGAARGGNQLSANIILHSIYAQQTVSDVVYVFLCSIQYFFTAGAAPEVLGNTIFGSIPSPFYGVLSNYNYTIFLKKNFLPNPGGGLFYSEGMLALGPVGVLAYAWCYAKIIYYLFRKRHSRYAAVIFLTLILMVCRTQWYGMLYCYKPVLISCFFCYICKSLNRKTVSRRFCSLYVNEGSSYR